MKGNGIRQQPNGQFNNYKIKHNPSIMPVTSHNRPNPNGILQNQGYNNINPNIQVHNFHNYQRVNSLPPNS